MVISVAFGKGGTGKTSTAHALVNYAAMQGKSVLAIDADPQANFTYALGGNGNAPGLFEVLTDRIRTADAIQHTPQAHLISSRLELSTAEQMILNKPRRDFVLKDALKGIRNKYDLIVIDTKPDINFLLVNVLSASDTVLLPMGANAFSFIGLYLMRDTIEQVQKYCNPALTVAGIVLTKYKPRQTLASDMQESIMQQAQEMGTKVFNTYIREGVVVEQAQSMQQSLFEYAPKSNPAKDYEALFQEMNI